MDRFDDEMRRRLARAGEELARSGAAGPAPKLADAVRRHRRRVVTQVAGATLAVTLVAVAGPRLLPPDRAVEPAAPLGLTVGTPAPESPAPATPAPGPTPTEQPDPAAPTADPEPSPEPPAPVPSGSPEPTVEPSTRPSPSPCHAYFRPETPPDGLEVTLEASARTIRRGESLTLTVRVTNTGLTPVSYEETGYHYDFWATQSRRSVWLWSAYKAHTLPLFHVTLQPGESRSATETWDLTSCPAHDGVAGEPVPPGTYDVHGAWVGDGEHWIAKPVRVVVT